MAKVEEGFSGMAICMVMRNGVISLKIMKVGQHGTQPAAEHLEICYTINCTKLPIYNVHIAVHSPYTYTVVWVCMFIAIFITCTRSSTTVFFVVANAFCVHDARTS